MGTGNGENTMATRRITGRAAVSSPAMDMTKIDPAKLDILALGGAKVSLDIPSDATLVQGEETLKQLAAAHGHLERAVQKIGWMIGKVLHTIRERNLYKQEGFDSWTSYLAALPTRVALSERTAWNMVGLVEAFPSLTQGQFAQFGVGLLLKAKQYKITEKDDPARYQQILNEAVKGTVKQFEQNIKETRRLIAGNAPASPPAELHTISIKDVTSETRDKWQGLLKQFDGTAAELIADMIAVYEEADVPAETTA